MSAAKPTEVGRRLFAAVRREQPPADLRARVLAQRHAEQASVEVAPFEGSPLAASRRERALPPQLPLEGAERPESGAVRASGWRRALLGGGALAAGAGGLIALGALEPGPDAVEISAERSGGGGHVSAAHASPTSAPSPRAREAIADDVEPSRLPERVGHELVSSDAPLSEVPSHGADPRGAAPSSVTPEPASTPLPPEPAPPPVSLSEQLEQIKRVRGSLRSGDPQRALALLDEYGARSPGAAFAAEASLLRIEALAAAGRAADAAALARQFATTYPNSPLIDRARSYAGSPTGAEPAQTP